MVSVVIAVVSTLGAVLAGLAPAMLLSERRRLLRFLTDESTALEAVKDEPSREQLRKALRATSRQYHQLAKRTKVEKRRRQLYASFFPIYVLLAFGVAGSFTDLGDTPEQKKLIEQIGSVCLIVGVFWATAMLFRVSLARQDEKRESRELATERARRTDAESVIDQVQLKLGEGSRPLAVHEVQNLLSSWQQRRIDDYNEQVHRHTFMRDSAIADLKKTRDKLERDGDDGDDAGVPAKV